MNTFINSEKNRQKLINELMPWWKRNGWNPKTLENKNLSTLLALKRKMIWKKVN